MTPPQPIECAIPLDMAPDDRRDDRNFWTNALAAAILAILPLIALRRLLVVAPIGGETLLGACTIADILYVAGALSIFGVTWLAPTGAARLRPTLAGCLSSLPACSACSIWPPSPDCSAPATARTACRCSSVWPT